MHGKKKKIEMHLSSGQVSLLFPSCSIVQLLLYLSFGQVGKNWKNKCVISLVQKDVQRNYVLKGLILVQRIHTCPTEKITCLGRVESIFFAPAMFQSIYLSADLYLVPMLVAGWKYRGSYFFEVCTFQISQPEQTLQNLLWIMPQGSHSFILAKETNVLLVLQ